MTDLKTLSAPTHTALAESYRTGANHLISAGHQLRRAAGLVERGQLEKAGTPLDASLEALGEALEVLCLRDEE